MVDKHEASVIRLPKSIISEISESSTHHDTKHANAGFRKLKRSAVSSRKELRKARRLEKKHSKGHQYKANSTADAHVSKTNEKSQPKSALARDGFSKATTKPVKESSLSTSKSTSKPDKSLHGASVETDKSVQDTWAALENLKAKKHSRGNELTKNTSSTLRTESNQRELAKEDESLQYYAKKLKLKHSKLEKFEEGEDFENLLGGLGTDDSDNYDSEEKNLPRSQPEIKSAMRKKQTSREIEETLDELDGSSDLHDLDMDTVSASLGSSDNTSTSDDEENHTLEKAAPVKVRENPYVAPTTGRYVPPSVRSRLAAKEDESGDVSDLGLRLQRRVKGLLNRLSDSNIDSILSDLDSLYRTNARHLVNTTITRVISDSIALQGVLQDSFVTVHATIAVGLFRSADSEFGAILIQYLVETFDKQRAAKSSKEASNLLSLIAELYILQLISCTLIYDLIRELIPESGITELETELLLRLVRMCGTQLRSDDPNSLKEIICMLQVAVSKSPDGLNPRTQFLVESVTALKNNRQKNRDTAMIVQMKKFLGGIKNRPTGTGINSSEPLRVTLEDIRQIESRGKWWVVGAAWKDQAFNNSRKLADGLDSDKEDVQEDLMELARQQRMNTDVRKAIFVSLMSSGDYLDAYERLNKLGLKNVQEREIPRVLLHCCSNEQPYNNYYALVAGKLCGKHSLKKTFQFCLWDFLRQCNEEQPDKAGLSKIVNYGRFYASLVNQGSLTLSVLKAVDFLTIGIMTRLFLEVLLVGIFIHVAKQGEKPNSERNVVKSGFAFRDQKKDEQPRDGRHLVRILTGVKEKAILAGLQLILRDVDKSEVLNSRPKDIERVKWAVSLGSEIMNELIQKEDDD